MDRRSVEAVLLAGLALVALAAAAATLPSATTGGGGSGVGPAAGGEGEGGVIPTPAPRDGPTIDLSFLRPILLALTAIAVALFVLYTFLYRRRAFRLLVGFAILFAVVAVLFWLVSMLDLGSPSGPGFGVLPFGEPAGSSEDQAPTARPLVLLVVVGLLLVGAAVVLVRSGAIVGDDTESDEPPGPEEVAAVGRAAGRAADRIETTDDLDNEIYRAWREMTGLLDVDRPASSTPGEFAAAATAAGMDRDDVGELTRLFEDVRYGGDEPTATKERRALDILRRVEATYVPADGDRDRGRGGHGGGPRGE